MVWSLDNVAPKVLMVVRRTQLAREKRDKKAETRATKIGRILQASYSMVNLRSASSIFAFNIYMVSVVTKNERLLLVLLDIYSIDFICLVTISNSFVFVSIIIYSSFSSRDASRLFYNNPTYLIILQAYKVFFTELIARCIQVCCWCFEVHCLDVGRRHHPAPPPRPFSRQI
jgi:hypothetical protein